MRKISPKQLKENMAERRGSPRMAQAFLNQADFGHAPRKLQKSLKSFKQQVAEIRQHDLSS